LEGVGHCRLGRIDGRVSSVAAEFDMSEFQDFKRKFSNNRQWREFVAAVHESVAYPCAVTYPKVISTLRSNGQNPLFFAQNTAQ
jgi:hypothetical protein